MIHDLTGFQRDLLFIVAGLDGPNGLTVKDELEQYYGQEVRHGRLYPNLDTLVEMGLINKGQKDRRTNEYTLLPPGYQEIRARFDWQSQYCPDEILEQVELQVAETN